MTRMMHDPQLALSLTALAAIQSRRSGHRRGQRIGQSLRIRLRDLLIARGPLTDHAAGELLGCLSTTVGARRAEWLKVLPGCIVAADRVLVTFADRDTAWRVRWRYVGAKSDK